MIRDIQILEEGEVIRAVYRGEAEYPAITGMLRNVARMASEKQITRLLEDAGVNRGYEVRACTSEAGAGPGCES